jgi:hypothetical protein
MWLMFDETKERQGWVDLPEGYYPVRRGALKPGDLHLDCVEFQAGQVVWKPAPIPAARGPYDGPEWSPC